MDVATQLFIIYDSFVQLQIFLNITVSEGCQESHTLWLPESASVPYLWPVTTWLPVGNLACGQLISWHQSNLLTSVLY